MTKIGRKYLYVKALQEIVEGDSHAMCLSLISILHPHDTWDGKAWREVENLTEFKLMHPSGSGDRFAWGLEFEENPQELRETILSFCIALAE